ncbi:hypothetical protein [Bradyrhizobium sp. dw_411]|uniref:hypothetical protein n=1 Tax=Bradyrhizobium sp. dw_411 TaxID=2720082 RepID=UPI001BCC3EA1|nr:hypothetical protein [Bradyrhizobium sp. dw_411]
MNGKASASGAIVAHRVSISRYFPAEIAHVDAFAGLILRILANHRSNGPEVRRDTQKSTEPAAADWDISGGKEDSHIKRFKIVPLPPAI